MRIRSAVRRNTFARHIASSSPINVTLPSSTSEISYPRSIISRFSTASSPKWHGAINSILLILLLLPGTVNHFRKSDPTKNIFRYLKRFRNHYHFLFPATQTGTCLVACPRSPAKFTVYLQTTLIISSD